MLTTIALSLLNIVLLLLLVRREAELDEARARARTEHELACILQQVARREWRPAQAWRERAEQDEIPEPCREWLEGGTR